jgi:two-component system, OmpR family, sensor histidine kinase ChvG
MRWAWSLTAKTTLLAIIFALVPLFLYVEFRAAYEEGQELLLRSVRNQGRAISQSLLPMLETADRSSLPQVNGVLARFANEVTTIKLLLAPAGADSDGFYYVGSWPSVDQSSLAAERHTLQDQGVLDRLSHGCRGEMPFSLIYHRPTGGSEIVTAVTPLKTAAGCWAVVASFSADAYPSAHLGEPYWATPTVRVAGLIYLAMAAITFSTLFSIRRSLRRFAERARQIRNGGPGTGSFAARNDLPELASVAAEFDRMVEALHRSAAAMRRAAEDNAHAFKTPIAVIRQSLEPLRRALRADDQRAQRAIGVVESSIDRLDGLVASARRLDETAADLIAHPRTAIDLAPLIGGLMRTHSAIVPERNVRVVGELADGMFVLGSDEIIENIVENVLENAVSFAPPESEVRVLLMREADSACITVVDQGPGVPASELARIFDRYYSERRAPEENGQSTYFGIGLSIARRYVEALGGTIAAENRQPQGLAIRIRLPLANRQAVSPRPQI